LSALAARGAVTMGGRIDEVLGAELAGAGLRAPRALTVEGSVLVRPLGRRMGIVSKRSGGARVGARAYLNV